MKRYKIIQIDSVTYLQPNNYEEAARIVYIAQIQCKVSVGIIMRFSSRFVGRPDDLDKDENRMLMYFRLGCESASSIDAPNGAGQLQNRLYLLLDKLNDLPAWFYLGVPRVKSISIPKPDYRIRTDIIEKLFFGFPGTEWMDASARKEVVDKFVGLTDGLSTTDIDNIRQLMMDRDIEFGNIEKAVQLYRHGVHDNPWENLETDFLAGIEDRIKARIVGQDRVIKRAVDVIKRAAMGMSGLQQSSNSSRPRGVLFLAGPTGTGKTELAKAIAEQLFKDERNIVRFDMSEYREPQSDQRLLGAPPGYIGYEEGGQLTNAVREKPFSVLLFDEIEKAHPSILDKFLQILDDGRITDGRGETVYFQDCLIVFTSNLGIMKAAGDGTWTPNVSYDDRLSEEELENKVISEIRRYFREYISRPELLNRIGDNILVFDYIREDIAKIDGIDDVINQFANRIIMYSSKEDVQMLLGEASHLVNEINPSSQGTCVFSSDYAKNAKSAQLAYTARNDSTSQKKMLEEISNHYTSLGEEANVCILLTEPSKSKYHPFRRFVDEGALPEKDRLFIGESLTLLKDFDYYPEKNLWILGGDSPVAEMAGYGTMFSCLLSLILGKLKAKARGEEFEILCADGNDDETGYVDRNDRFWQFCDSLMDQGDLIHYVPGSMLSNHIRKLMELVQTRKSKGDKGHPVWLLVSMVEGCEGVPDQDKMALRKIMDDGPENGIHTILWTKDAKFARQFHLADAPCDKLVLETADLDAFGIKIKNNIASGYKAQMLGVQARLRLYDLPVQPWMEMMLRRIDSL